jgi:hypothetical protein
MPSARIPLPYALLTTATLVWLGASGCVVISSNTPKAQATPPPPAVQTAVAVRYTPYAANLDRVIRQEAKVAREFRRRDWAELRDELGDWQHDVRRLAGSAEMTRDPDALRAHCRALLDHIQRMRVASRDLDADKVAAELDAVAPILNRLSHDFPLTEPLDGERSETNVEVEI